MLPNEQSEVPLAQVPDGPNTGQFLHQSVWLRAYVETLSSRPSTAIWIFSEVVKYRSSICDAHSSILSFSSDFFWTSLSMRSIFGRRRVRLGKMLDRQERLSSPRGYV